MAMQRAKSFFESLILVEDVDIVIYPRVEHTHGLLFLTKRLQVLDPHQKLSFDDQVFLSLSSNLSLRTKLQIHISGKSVGLICALKRSFDSVSSLIRWISILRCGSFSQYYLFLRGPFLIIS